MADQHAEPRVLSHTRRWWQAAALLAILTAVSILIREGAAAYQGWLLEKAGWDVHDLSRLYDIIQTRDLALAPDSTLWVAAGKVLSFDGTDWNTFSADADDLAIDAEGNIWFANGKGIGFIKDGTIHPVNPDLEDVILASDPQGRVWYTGRVAFGDGIVRLYSPDQSSEPLPTSIQDSWLLSMTFDPEGMLWMSDQWSEALYVYDGKTWTPRSHAFGRAGVDAITFGPDGRVWMGGGDPPAIVVEQGDTWQRQPLDVPGSTGGGIAFLSFDQWGTLWVGCWPDDIEESRVGLASYAEDQWTYYQTGDVQDPLKAFERGITPAAYALVIDSAGNPWFIVDALLVKLDPRAAGFSADPVPAGVALARIRANTFAWILGALACLAIVVASWSTFLKTKLAGAWQASLEMRGAKPKPGILGSLLLVLAPGILLIVEWVGILRGASEGGPWLQDPDSYGILLALGAIPGGLLLLGARSRRARSLSARAIGVVATLLAVVVTLILLFMVLNVASNAW